MCFFLLTSTHTFVFLGVNSHWYWARGNTVVRVRRQGDLTQHPDHRNGARPEGDQGWGREAQDWEVRRHDRAGELKAREQHVGDRAEELEGGGEGVQVQGDQAAHRLLGAGGGERSSTEAGSVFLLVLFPFNSTLWKLHWILIKKDHKIANDVEKSKCLTRT